MFSKDTYINRRGQLLSKLDSGLGLFIANPDTPMNCKANHMKYRQDSNFYYFFGINHPGFAAIMNFKTKEIVVFGNDVDIDDIIWMGELPTVKNQAEEIGVVNTRRFDELKDYIVASGESLMFFPQYRAENKILISKLSGKNTDEVEKDYSIELTKAVIDIRSIKEAQEVEEIEKCADILYEIHTTMMKLAKDGVEEQYIAGVLEAIPYKYGGRVSFPVILSQNGQILHNHNHSLKCQEGRLLLCDAGGESSSLYATDATRTVPIGGKFTQKQREIYNIVVEANLKAIDLIKPGVPYRDIHIESAKVIFNGLKNLGLCKGDTEAAVSEGVHALFYPHGLGHMLGLDVHDMEDMNETLVGYDDEIQRSTQFGLSGLRLGRRLQENFVITVEPGIYFIPALIDIWEKENKFSDYLNYEKINQYRDFGGIRIEDDILVTKDGSRVLGKPIPKTAEEVEEFMQNN